VAGVKRGGDIQRKTPIERRTALTASPLARSSLHAAQASRERAPKAKRRVKPAVPARILAALTHRSGGVCEMALPGCTEWATDPAHRIRQGMGGRKGAAKTAHDVLSNLLHACRRCHSRTHAEPAFAYSLGLMLRDGSDPLAEPAQYRGVRRWLTDCGSVLTSNPTPIAKEA
jgi:hypothetical protein